jgi:predicted nucleic acid-binding protein
VERAWVFFSTFQDKGWSFTVCVSRVVMERLSIATACAFDVHFRQFGTVAVVP